MKNIYLFELSDVFANQVYLPYCSGVVWSYVKNNPYIKDNYKLKDWFYARDDAKNIIDKIENPDILLFSCFMWNWNLNCEIAKTIKENYPSCKIMFGGQHQPLADRAKGFFNEHPYVDVLIHSEGEETVKELLYEKPYEEIKGITYNVNNKTENIFSDLNLKIRRDDRIGIIGANGSGKSTLVKILQGIYPPQKGKIKFGENVNIKYFDQNKQSINLNKTPWSTLVENGDHVDFMGEKIHILSYLKRFLFDEKKCLQSNSTLSGGEKVRLLLAKTFLKKHNFLILDEPTNDLDFDTLNLLKVTVKNYDGTVLIISHDRFFLDKTVEKLLVFENNNRISKHEGNFSDYYKKFGLEKLKIVNSNFKNKISNKKIITKKVINKKKMSFKDTYYLEMLPLKIEKLEKELKKCETILNDKDLFKNDRKSFDKASIEITNIKKIISESENKLLELQILNEEMNNP